MSRHDSDVLGTLFFYSIKLDIKVEWEEFVKRVHLGSRVPRQPILSNICKRLKKESRIFNAVWDESEQKIFGRLDDHDLQLLDLTDSELVQNELKYIDSTAVRNYFKYLFEETFGGIQVNPATYFIPEKFHSHTDILDEVLSSDLVDYLYDTTSDVHGSALDFSISGIAVTNQTPHDVMITETWHRFEMYRIEKEFRGEIERLNGTDKLFKYKKALELYQRYKLVFDSYSSSGKDGQVLTVFSDEMEEILKSLGVL